MKKQNPVIRASEDTGRSAFSIPSYIDDIQCCWGGGVVGVKGFEYIMHNRYYTIHAGRSRVLYVCCYMPWSKYITKSIVTHFVT